MSTSVTPSLLCVYAGRPGLTMSKNSLFKNEELRKGDSLVSNNGQWKAVFQDDANFVIYGWSPVWASDTEGTDAHRLCMQHDCNLVMYNKDGKAVWHTNSAKDTCSMCRLCLSDDGKLVLSREADDVWNSTKNRGMK